MAIITISRGSYSRGKDVAEKVAARLGFECLSRDIVLETATQLNIPEIKLIRALHDAPSILDRLTGGKERFVADFRSVLLEHLKKDNIVYHGLAGQFFLRGVPHVLKVRILANFDQRVQEEMKREHISEKVARQLLAKDDSERRQWSVHLYGVDTWDPNLYDLVIKIDTLSIDNAADIIADTARLPRFQKTTESQNKLNDLALIAKVQTRINDPAVVSISGQEGNIKVVIKPGILGQSALVSKTNAIKQEFEGIKTIEIEKVGN